MSTTQTGTTVIPSSPADLKKIKQMLGEAVNCEVRIAAERDTRKEIINEIHEQFELPKKMLGRMVKTMYNHNYSEIASEMDEFQLMFEKITQS